MKKRGFLKGIVNECKKDKLYAVSLINSIIALLLSLAVFIIKTIRL